MDTKLNHSELNALFAKASDMPLTESEAFTKALFDTIIEGLEADGIVKVNGLGTFKVIDVDSRSSVDVNTGERIEIKGHKKLSFVPADSLKETINAPFAMFQPVEVDDSLDEEGESFVSPDEDGEEAVTEEIDSEEMAAALAKEPVLAVEKVPDVETIEEPQQPFSITEVEEEMPAEQEEFFARTAMTIDEEMPMEMIEENPVHEHHTSVEISAEESVTEEVVTEEEAPAEEAADAAVEVAPVEEKAAETEASIAEESVIAQPQAVAVAEPAKEEDAAEPKKDEDAAPTKKDGTNNKAIVYAVICILLIGAVAYYFYDCSKQNIKEAPVVVKIEKVEKSTAAEVAAVADSVKTAEKVSNDTIQSIAAPENMAQQATREPFVVVDALAARSLSVISLADTLDYAFAGTMCKHTVSIEETLTKISLLHYGDKKLWPYIVKYNNMLRPNDLACGMELEIPLLVPRK